MTEVIRGYKDVWNWWLVVKIYSSIIISKL